MSNQHHPATGVEQQVTASDLVRHFGLWQERAARAPVYVLHRGRPRLVLTSLDVMDALCAPHADGESIGAEQVNGLLDADEGVTIVVSATGEILLASHGARRRFGAAAAPGGSVASLATVAGDLLSDAVARVAETGVGETIELAWQRYAARRVQCRIEPFPGGCILRATDVEAADELRALGQRHAATLAAAESAGAIGARVTLRGLLSDPSPALSRLTGVSPDALVSARFTSLFQVGDRVIAGEAVERAIGDGQPTSFRAGLLIRGAGGQPVVVGLAPIREAAQVIALIATIVVPPDLA